VHANSHSEMRSLWETKGEFLQSLSTDSLTGRVFHTLGTPAQTCQATFQQFQTTADGCLPSVSGIFAPNTTMASGDVHTAINAYCAAGACDSQMKTAAQHLKTDCIDSGVFGQMCGAHTDANSCTENSTLCAWDAGAGQCHINGNFFGQLRMILNVFCISNDAVSPPKLCIPSFFDFVNTKPDAQTTDTLTSGCDVCTLKVFQMWSKTEPLQAAVHFLQLSLVCLKRQDTFCVLHQRDLDNANKIAPPACETFTASDTCAAAAKKCRWNGQKCEELWTVDKLGPICHPCTLVYANRALFLMKLMDSFHLPDLDHSRAAAIFGLSAISYTINGVCSTDLQDQYCMPKLQATNADFSCAGMGNYLKTVGCCAPSLVDFVQGLCNLDQVIHPTTSTCQPSIDTMKTQINSCTGITLGKPCAEIKYQLLHEAIVSGVAADWYAAHKDALVTELKKVIAFAIGVDIAVIIDLKIAAATATAGRRLLADGDLQVTTTISIPQAGANQAATEGLKGELDPLGLNDAIQTSTPGGGSLGSATVTTLSTTNVAVVGNSAYTAAPVLVAAIAVAGLFF